MPERIGLVVHPTRDVEQALGTLTRWASARGVEVVQVGDGRREIARRADAAAGDLLVALGGDGTVLATLRTAIVVEAPVLGVACGSLGALSAVTADELEAALERVWEGDWTPRSLPALSIDVAGGLDHWAINDFVVVRRGAGQLVAELHVGDELYARLAGDGLIVATAVGSSAYSMAAGGPVLAGDTPAFVCTPLAMHGGSAPPLVVPADAPVTVVVQPGFAGFDVEIDGQDRPTEAHRFRLRLHPDKVTLVALDPPGHGLAGLRRRRLIADSPRILARDHREQKRA
jgi:NAD+ kinase